MKDAEFLQKLSQVAEWKLPDTPRETSLNAKKQRGRPNAEDEYTALRERIFREEFGNTNPTFAPMLTKIKVATVICEDCGKVCENGRQKEARLHQGKERTAWREKCVTCDRFQNPFTGQFNLTGSAASLKWNDFMRSTQMKYRTERNTLIQSALDNHTVKVVAPAQEDCGIITYLPENPHKI